MPEAHVAEIGAGWPYITGDVVEIYANWHAICTGTSGMVEACDGQRFSVEATCETRCRATPEHSPADSSSTVYVRPLESGTMRVTVTLRHLTTHQSFTKQLEFEAEDPESLDLHCDDNNDLRASCL